MLGGQLNTVEQLFAGAGDGLMGHSLEERRAFNPNGGMPAPMLERRGTAEGSIQYTGSGTQGQNNNQAEGGNAGSEGDATEDDSKSARAKKPHLQGRFSGRLVNKEDEKRLAEECRLLGPLLGGVGKKGDRSRLTLAKIVRGIASGEIRRHVQEQAEQLRRQADRLEALERDNSLLRAELDLKARRLHGLESGLHGMGGMPQMNAAGMAQINAAGMVQMNAAGMAQMNAAGMGQINAAGMAQMNAAGMGQMNAAGMGQMNAASMVGGMAGSGLAAAQPSDTTDLAAAYAVLGMTGPNLNGMTGPNLNGGLTGPTLNPAGTNSLYNTGLLSSAVTSAQLGGANGLSPNLPTITYEQQLAHPVSSAQQLTLMPPQALPTSAMEQAHGNLGQITQLEMQHMQQQQQMQQSQQLMQQQMQQQHTAAHSAVAELQAALQRSEAHAQAAAAAAAASAAEAAAATAYASNAAANMLSSAGQQVGPQAVLSQPSGMQVTSAQAFGSPFGSAQLQQQPFTHACNVVTTDGLQAQGGGLSKRRSRGATPHTSGELPAGIVRVPSGADAVQAARAAAAAPTTDANLLQAMGLGGPDSAAAPAQGGMLMSLLHTNPSAPEQQQVPQRAGPTIHQAQRHSRHQEPPVLQQQAPMQQQPAQVQAQQAQASAPMQQEQQQAVREVDAAVQCSVQLLNGPDTPMDMDALLCGSLGGHVAAPPAAPNFGGAPIV